MNALEFYCTILIPSAFDLPPTMSTSAAECMLLAIAGQESAWRDRIQIPNGQARGFWQCERGILAGVMAGSQASILHHALTLYSLPADKELIFEALAWHDTLAYTVARTALWMDPCPLAAIGDEAGAWEIYERVWRPGRPSRERWSNIYPQAVSAMQVIA